MSGWHSRDNKIEEDYGDDFPAVNNITVRGALPADQVPSPTQSRTLPEAHFKSLRLFRKWCRFMPFIVSYTGYRRYASPEQAKLNLANHWRQHNKVRDIDSIDMFTCFGYERLYNIQQGDVWGGYILDQIAPVARDHIDSGDGFSFLEEKKYENKSSFLRNFYEGGKKPNY